jgi:uncharacterized protein (UPF0332 family)
MTQDPSEQLIQYRLQQANESLKEADTLYQASFWRGAVNRAYYAMFYAVLALTVLRQEVTSKHSGAITFFDREFVKSKIFPTELSKSLHLAFQRRQENDYGEVFTVSQQEAQHALKDAHTFVTAIRQYFEGSAGNTDKDSSGKRNA